jgi:hypothetical protein
MSVAYIAPSFSLKVLDVAWQMMQRICVTEDWLARPALPVSCVPSIALSAMMGRNLFYSESDFTQLFSKLRSLCLFYF